MANKKVSQLTSKPSVLTTDLVPIADPSTGQLFKTTLSSLGAVIGSAVASVNGLVGVVVLDTDDIQELASPTNKWFTDTRARAALSAGTGISYNSGTGVISSSVTLADLGGVPTSRTLTINGTAFDLSADRSWSINSMVYPGAGIPISTGTAWGTSITNNSDNWNTAYGWGNHAGLYLPIGGGTLTGALLGTTAGFSGKITANHSSAGDYAAVFYNSSATGEGVIVRGGSSSSNNAFIVQNFNGTTTLFKVLASGDSTFSNIVTAISFVKSGGTSTQFLKADGSIDSNTYLTTAGAAAQYQPIGTYSTGSGESSRLARWTSTSNLSVAQIWDDGTNIGIGQTPGAFKLDVTGTQRVTGAATFGSSVTATSFVKTSGTSAQFLKADGSVDSSTYLTTTSAAAQYQPIGSYAGGSGSSSRLARWISSTDLSVAQIWDDGTNIGIGQAPGAFKLDVTGTMRVTGATTFSSSVTATGDIIAGVGAGIVSGGGGYAIGPSSTRGIIALNGSGDQILTFSTQSYIYNNSSLFRMLSTSDIDFVSGGSQRMIIKSSGNVGIGTTAPNSILEIAATTPVFRIQASDSANLYGIEFRQGAGFDAFIKQLPSTGEFRISNGRSVGWGGHMTFYTDTAERMRITSGGNVGIGATSAAYKLTVVGDIRGYKLIGGEAGVGAGNYTIFSNDDNVGYIDTVRAVNSGDFQFRFSGTSRVTISTGGNVTATGFFESSDKNLKTLIEDNYQAKGIESITAKLYLKNGVKELGYFAQDVQAILPSAVNKGADGFLNLSYREVHTAKIARLEKRVEELEAQLNLV